MFVRPLALRGGKDRGAFPDVWVRPVTGKKYSEDYLRLRPSSNPHNRDHRLCLFLQLSCIGGWAFI